MFLLKAAVCFLIELMKLGRVLHKHKKSTGNTTGDKSEQDCVLTSLTPGLTFDFHPVVSYC